MPKINPWAHARPERRVVTETFSDPAHPEVELTVSLHAPDPTEWALVYDRTDELTEEYVTGKDGQEPNLFPAPDGKPIKLSRRMCYNCALLEQMQSGPAAERYGLVDLIGLAVIMPVAWDQILGFASRAIAGEGARGNDSEADTAS